MSRRSLPKSTPDKPVVPTVVKALTQTKLCFSILFAGVFLALGLWQITAGIQTVLLAARSNGWPRVSAVITASTVSTNRGGRSKSYQPRIEYSYSVDGRIYSARQIRIVTQLPRAESFAKECAGRYPVGTNAKAAYKPGEPATAVLEPGLSKGAFVGLVGGAGIIIFGAFLLSQFVSTRFRKRRFFIICFCSLVIFFILFAIVLSP